MEDNKQDNQPAQKEPGGYGKRPMWQWVLLYLVLGGIVYWFIYYIATADSNGGGLY